MIPLQDFNVIKTGIVHILLKLHSEMSQEFLFLGNKSISVCPYYLVWKYRMLPAKLKAMSLILLIFLRFFTTSHQDWAVVWLACLTQGLT